MTVQPHLPRRALAPLLTGSLALALTQPHRQAQASPVSPLHPANYLARGTVAQRSVAAMPVLPNSAQMANYLKNLHSTYVTDQFKGRLPLSGNVFAYNIPIHTVNSKDPHQNYEWFYSFDHRVKYQSDEYKKLMGAETPVRIPLPKNFQIPGGGDRSIAVYDLGTGLWRSFFMVQKTTEGEHQGRWHYSSGGYIKDARALAGSGHSLQLTGGSSSVVGMASELTQIGIDEVLAGRINHAVSFTLPNARSGYSWPARQGDGNLTDPLAPYEGQWFRINPAVNLDSLGLRPLTLMIAKALQKYGGYGIDRNIWCMAANYEYDTSQTEATQGNSRWYTQVQAKYGQAPENLHDFPFQHLQFAPKDWKGGL